MVKIKNVLEVKAFETTEDHYQQLQRPNKSVRSNHLNIYLELTKTPRLILKSRRRHFYTFRVSTITINHCWTNW